MHVTVLYVASVLSICCLHSMHDGLSASNGFEVTTRTFHFSPLVLEKKSITQQNYSMAKPFIQQITQITQITQTTQTTSPSSHPTRRHHRSSKEASIVQRPSFFLASSIKQTLHPTQSSHHSSPPSSSCNGQAYPILRETNRNSVFGPPELSSLHKTTG